MSNIRTIEELREAFAQAKAQEELARQQRLEVEEEILAHPEFEDMPAEGSRTIEGVRVTRKLYRKWDQTKLTVLGEGVHKDFWPFKSEWKEDRRRSREVFESLPDLKLHVEQALTLTPAKPAITITED